MNKRRMERYSGSIRKRISTQRNMKHREGLGQPWHLLSFHGGIEIHDLWSLKTKAHYYMDHFPPLQYQAIYKINLYFIFFTFKMRVITSTTIICEVSNVSSAIWVGHVLEYLLKKRSSFHLPFLLIVKVAQTKKLNI